MENKPYIVTYTVTYSASYLVYAKDANAAGEYAERLYESGGIDPEEYGPDDTSQTVRNATPRDLETYKWETFTAEEED